MEMLQLAFGIHGQLCEELAVIIDQNVIQLLTEENCSKNFTLHVLVLFCVSIFIDYSVCIH